MSQESTTKKTGTTTVGLIFKDGVIMAADKRASMGYMIAHKNVEKLVQLTNTKVLSIAGGVGDAQALIRYIKAEIKLYKLRNAKEIKTKTLATFISNILFSGKNQFFPYYVQFLLGGVDEEEKKLFVIGPDGSLLADPFISTGSGSVFAYGLLQENYKEGMKLEEAIKLAVKSVNVAIQRDMATGDGIDLVIITKNGVKRLTKKEIESHLKH